MIDKKDLVTLYTQEAATTAKVIKSLPEGHLDFKPHEKSNSLKAILRTEIVGFIMNEKFLKGEAPENSMDSVNEFDSIQTAVEEFEKVSSQFLSNLQAASEADLQQPFSMWGMEGTRAEIIHSMLLDMIHHRGQLTVYIRLLDGKVPSVYGPTADEPMNSPA